MQSLDSLIEEYRSILIAEKHLKTVNSDLALEQNKLAILVAKLDAIAHVLEKGSETGLRHLFKKTLVNEDEQHEIEKQNYLLTALKYRQCKQTIELIEYERNILTEKLKTKLKVEGKLNMTIDSEKMEIANKYPRIRRRLFEINEALKDIINYKREIYEARLVSIKVHESLEIMLRSIKKSQKQDHWGEFNLKEEKKGKYYKISGIDDAHIESSKTVQLIKKLKDELEDIIEFKPLTKMYTFEELMHFQDYFSESLITDWIVKNNVNVSEQRVSNTLKYIQRIMASLDKYKAKADFKYKQLYESKIHEINNAKPLM